jgi:hypothetical protein
VLRPGGFRHEHRLDDQRRRDRNPRQHRQGGERPRLPAQRENREAERRQGERSGELARERVMPAAAAVSDATDGAPGAHQAEQHARKRGISTFNRVRGEAGRRRRECYEESDNQRTDDEDDLDQHRFRRVSCRKQRVVGERLPEVSPHANRNRREGRARGGSSRERKPGQLRAARSGHEHEKRARKGERASGQDAPRAVPVDKAPEDRRYERESGHVTTRRRSAKSERSARRLQ